jgi:hypothetical protein
MSNLCSAALDNLMPGSQLIFILASFLLAVLSAVIAIAQFVFAEPAKNPATRYVLGAIFMIMAMVLGVTGVAASLYLPIFSSTESAPPNSSATVETDVPQASDPTTIIDPKN